MDCKIAYKVRGHCSYVCAQHDDCSAGDYCGPDPTCHMDGRYAAAATHYCYCRHDRCNDIRCYQDDFHPCKQIIRIKTLILLLLYVPISITSYYCIS